MSTGQKPAKVLNLILWIVQVVLAFIDLMGVPGLVLPGLLRIQPRVTILAAYGVVVLMVAASIFHISKGEFSQIGFNLFVAVLAAFIAWGRQTKAPIRPK